jgi:hypothetical protein
MADDVYYLYIYTLIIKIALALQSLQEGRRFALARLSRVALSKLREPRPMRLLAP